MGDRLSIGVVSHIAQMGACTAHLSVLIYLGVYMVIEFKSMEEFAIGVEKNVDDLVEMFDALFARFGIKPNDVVKTRILKAQDKRNREGKLFEQWIRQNRGSCFTEDDFPADVVEMVEEKSGLPVSEICYRSIGRDIDENNFYFPNIFRYKGKYYFNENGFIFFMYHFVFKGLISEERYRRWEDESGIKELPLKEF